MPHVRVARSAAVNDDTKCILCEFVLKEIDSLVSDNATEVSRTGCSTILHYNSEQLH